MVRSSRVMSSVAPHDEQKLETGGLRCPHWLQKSELTVSAIEKFPVAIRSHQSLKLGRIGHVDDT